MAANTSGLKANCFPPARILVSARPPLHDQVGRKFLGSPLDIRRKSRALVGIDGGAGLEGPAWRSFLARLPPSMSQNSLNGVAA